MAHEPLSEAPPAAEPEPAPDAPEEAIDRIDLEALVDAQPSDTEPVAVAEVEPAVTPAPSAQPAQPAQAGLRSARVVRLAGNVAMILLRGTHEEMRAHIAPEVERDVVADAVRDREMVLVEPDGRGEWFVVGVLRTRRPSEVQISADKVLIEGKREVLLRAGRAAIRFREDGDIEMVGSRISAASRGLFRLVGRILRLN